MARIIGIFSGKGGVGKTTITANLGLAMASQGMKVTLVDCNVTASHLGFLFGLYPYDKTLNDVLRGFISLEEAMYNYHGLSILPASLSLNSLVDLDINMLHKYIREIESDAILLDSAPGLGKEPMSVLQASNEVIFVTTPYTSALADVMKASRIVENFNIKILGIVLNMVKGLPHELNKREVEKITGIEVLEEIPYDESVNIALAFNKPVVEYFPFSPSSIAINRLASKITGRSFYQKETIFSKLLSSLRRIVGRKRIENLREFV
jgi:septum site-determining protein MinD